MSQKQRFAFNPSTNRYLKQARMVRRDLVALLHMSNKIFANRIGKKVSFETVRPVGYCRNRSGHLHSLPVKV
ncbi:MAG: hypothetical protein GDA40_11440 [Rhodobacteraceae bacterium]|nr:hypothetical protein [Paracoccaceae bacterium]